ncbi:hypothetical protein G7K_5512-t1 [Saitoella complicata NRRL Y-17804]|uniref:Uncharacterized protein n=1 Tax=Saitoella complicata (strain BCRC 22490 / CBS 7301 / JCM 7358 / NBRC 10748 / NRRL Y-17804) TaxID=698492 RepID=A0A0E9NPS2_SAICN|nr:hypothetical protein G7K_5512-t1 [Saitoella complicata NRRL Y-17804]
MHSFGNLAHLSSQQSTAIGFSAQFAQLETLISLAVRRSIHKLLASGCRPLVPGSDRRYAYILDVPYETAFISVTAANFS